MTESTTLHATFTLEREYPVAPERVFAAWADPVSKARWFAGSSESHELDFQAGGREINRATLDTGAEVTFASVYHDIVDSQRIIYSSTLSASDHGLATVSLTTVELVAEGAGTRLTLTEQGTYLDGHEDPSWREQGTSDWLDKLAEEFTTSVESAR